MMIDKIVKVSLLSYFLFCLNIVHCQDKPIKPKVEDLITPQEKSKNYSASYKEVMDYYERLANSFPRKAFFYQVDDADNQLLSTDDGYPFKVFRIGEVDNTRPNVLIINGIHPGEPEGIDASMQIARDILIKNQWNQIYNFYFIPIYNVEGALRRGSGNRPNQDGPEKMGFRGNSLNLDLNRDFIKMDSKNTKALVTLFHQIKPDLVIDNHTSNGADYPYTMTQLNNSNQLESNKRKYIQDNFLPQVFNNYNQKNYPIMEYVDLKNKIPDSGIVRNYYPPRFSQGYFGLFNTFAMTIETHKFKPFPQRVITTYNLMHSIFDVLYHQIEQNKYPNTIGTKINANNQKFNFDFKMNFKKKDSILFNGYQAEYISSQTTNGKRLNYNHNKPFKKFIPFYKTWDTVLYVNNTPIGYLIPKSDSKLIEVLKANYITIDNYTNSTIQNDQNKIISFKIKSFKNTHGLFPYEGHYLHSDVSLDTIFSNNPFNYNPEDPSSKYLWIDINKNQDKAYFLHYIFNPKAQDSYFNWNFFDYALSQKEYYSDYAFEDLAPNILSSDPILKDKFNNKMKSDSLFFSHPEQQLDFIYKNSKYAEQTDNLFPVYFIYKR